MIRDLLFTKDPYIDFPIVDNPPLKGWNSYHRKLAELIQELQPKLVLELGSWLGCSALFMSEHTDAEIVCVDTWTGSQEMWTNKDDPDRYQMLKIEHGYPTIYRSFMSNVMKAGKDHQITPMPLPTTVALGVLAHHGIQPDLIYVDASHDKSHVIADIKASLPLWPKILCGDDYRSWPGVHQGVHAVLPSVESEGDFWWFDRRKSNTNAAIE